MNQFKEKMQEYWKKIQQFFSKLYKDISKKENNEEISWSVGDIVATCLRTLKLLWDVMIALFVCLFLFGAGIGIGYAASLFSNVKVPKTEELVQQVRNVSSVSKLTYSDKSLIAEVDSDLIRTPVAGDAISDNVKKAVIATEDENFESHNGVVPKAVLRATLGSVAGVGSSSGGSTLTQQLIKQQVVGDAPTFTRKATEIVDALALERGMDKNEILTTYLNVSPFGRNNRGQNIAGVEAAAQGIFGVPAKDLSVPQAAFIAGLPQSPIVYSPYAADGSLKKKEDLELGLARAKDVLFNMYRTGVLSKKDYETYAQYDLTKDFLASDGIEKTPHDYLYFQAMAEAKDAMYDYLIKRDNVTKQDLKNNETVKSYQALAETELREGGYTIQTTINKPVHNAMQAAVANYGSVLDDGTGLVEVGNVLLDNRTGAILGFIGGRNFDGNQNNHAFNADRQVGSTIKPISVYGPAIDQGLIGSESRLANYPTTYADGREFVNSTTVDLNQFVTVRNALNWSFNIPVVHVNNELRKKMGDDNFSYNHYLSKMNYPASDAWAYESAPLGPVETNVVTQTNGFQALANKGKYQKAYMIEKITDNSGHVVYEHKDEGTQVYSPATASIMNDLLRSVVDSANTTKFKPTLAGLNPHLASADWVGKTGTTDEFKDSWLIVSTPTVTLSSWTGHDLPAPMTTTSGDNNGNYMANLANALYYANPELFGIGQKFELDPSVIKSKVSEFTGEKPGSITYNGAKFNTPGKTTTSYYAKDGAPQSTYKFGIGGTDSNYASYWGNLAPRATTNNNNNNNNKKNN